MKQRLHSGLVPAPTQPPAAGTDPLQASPRQVAQRARIAAAFGSAAQLRDGLDEDEAALQSRPAPRSDGLPAQLRAGAEALSGLDLSGVRVHRNSDKPAQLQALAYAQGNDIHLGPGQEQHLPHEAWHVVQQAQGRVQATRQLKEGVPVNDDAGLESEADAMGERAVAGVAQRQIAGHPHGLPRAVPAPVAQRRIHEWTGEAWTPGEQGKEGAHPLPDKPQGNARFFNDRTGNSAATAEAISDGLEQLAVQTGSVTEVMADGGAALAEVEQELPGLATFAIALDKRRLLAQQEQAFAALEALNEAHKQLKQDGQDVSENERFYAETEKEIEYLEGRIRRHEDPERVAGDSQVLYLGYFTFSAQDDAWKWDAGGDDCPEGAWKQKISTLLRSFMIANGQMAYIRSRNWYGQHTHKIEVDVNYYINRPFSTAPLYWHKDTGGGNLFVNLLFTNNQPIVGTEYTADTQAVSADKKSSLRANMPKEQVTDIENAREALKGESVGKNIEIGVLPKKGFVAWVDELIWHSSPFLANRMPWSAELAMAVMTNMVQLSTTFKQQTATTYEAMVLIANTPGTTLAQWVAEDKKKFDKDLADHYWYDEDYHLGDDERREAVLQDIAKVPWATYKVNEAFGHEQDGSDPRVKPSPKGPKDQEGQPKPFTLVTPSGMVGRNRSASVAAKQRDLKALVNENEKGRNFLRTWVRIIPK